MASQVDIYNLALARVGHTQLVASTEEGSNEALLCNVFYEQSRDFILREFPWRFAKRRTALALTAEQPTEVWGYCYVLPPDCLKVRSLATPGVRNPRVDQKVPFEVSNLDGAMVIYTDMEEAELIYTYRVTDTTLFDPTFTSAIAFHMAAELGLPLRGKADVSQLMRQAYSYTVSQAAANSMGEAFEPIPECELLTVRNG